MLPRSHSLLRTIPDSDLFELEYSADWNVDRNYFLDTEHRYTKMHRLLLEQRGSLDGAHILDLGCSRGQLLARFGQYRGVELTGLEIDATEIPLTRERIGLEPVRHYINAFDGVRMTATLPFEDASEDVILAGEIIEHIVDTEGFLAEIRRVLMPGGITVISTPNVLWWKYRVEMLFGKPPDCLQCKLEYGDDFGHVRTFTPDRLADLLRHAGLVDVKVVGKRLGPIASLVRAPSAAANVLDRLADRLPRLSDTVIALGMRPLTGNADRS